jgi:acetyl-CoA C-acetyltransferase
MIHDGLWDVYKNKHMGGCGDQCAAKYNFTREQQDEYAVSSYKRAIEHWENGFFEGAVVPVEIKTRKGVVTVTKDEDVAKFQGEEAMKALRPAFDPAGTITAGNASKINDGAASIVVFDDEKRERLGLKPAVRVLGHANVAVEPDWFSIAPIHAIRKLSEKINLPLSKVDLFEINEAFAVVAMVAIQELKLDREQVNVAGGAVAIGHPIGATGTRIVNTLIRALHRREKRIGIACLCIGGGEASAIAIERCS